MSEPLERFAQLRAGSFRFLEWPEQADRPPVLLLHGLSAVADVWRPTVERLPSGRGRVIAVDLRGHGQSARPAGRGAYTAARMGQDVVELCEALSLGKAHLAGHSMGARLAMVLASREAALFRSVVVVDIGPEAWAENVRTTVRSFEHMPRRFGSREDALTFVSRGRPPRMADVEMFFRRLRREPDGSYRWLGSPEAMVAAVTSQRRRHYWREWEAVNIPALLVRGGETREVRPRVAEEMRRRNPTVRYVEFDGIGHNVPLLAPERLASEMDGFWRKVERIG